MQITFKSITLLFVFIALFSCEKDNPSPVRELNCSTANFPTSDHPKASQYQSLIDAAVQSGMVGITATVQSPAGLWLGASGKADLASGADMEICNRVMVASCTKSFTASIIFKMVEQGRIKLDDKLGDLMPSSILKDIKNAPESEIQHLLSHTSGIADYYTAEFELQRANNYQNDFTQLDILEFTRGKKASNGIGEQFTYSNTNFLLLGLLLEELLNAPIEVIFQTQLLQPHGLSTAEYAFAVPADLVSGYGQVGSSTIVQSQRFYQDEMGSADGALVTTAYDLGNFIRQLGQGQIVTESSLAKMTDWFDMPSDEQDPDVGFLQNGFGLERYQTAFGNGYGHFGGVDGFVSVMLYFPEEDTTVAFTINGAIFENDNFQDLYDGLLDTALN